MVTVHDEVDPGIRNSLSGIEVLFSRFLQSCHSFANPPVRIHLCNVETRSGRQQLGISPLVRAICISGAQVRADQVLTIAQELHRHFNLKESEEKMPKCFELFKLKGWSRRAGVTLISRHGLRGLHAHVARLFTVAVRVHFRIAHPQIALHNKTRFLGNHRGLFCSAAARQRCMAA